MSNSREDPQEQTKGEGDQPAPDAESIKQQATEDAEQITGNVTSAGVGGDPGGEGHARTREVDILAVSKRLQARPEWPTIERRRDELMQISKSFGMNKRERQQWTYAKLDQQYPPEPVQNGHGGQFKNVKPAPDKDLQNQARVQGLQDIPAEWPELPNNASLQAEVAWCQAERLRVVHEQANGSTVVRLSMASTPAPSMAALSWLETSCRSYSKFIDVCAKATATQQDEAELVRRERVAIDEVRALLTEMLGDTCPTCGRDTATASE